MSLSLEQYIFEEGCRRLLFDATNNPPDLQLFEAWAWDGQRTTSRHMSVPLGVLEQYINEDENYYPGAVCPQEVSRVLAGRLKLFYSIQGHVALEENSLRQMPFSKEVLDVLVDRLYLPKAFPAHIASFKGVVPMLVRLPDEPGYEASYSKNTPAPDLPF